MTRTTDEPTEKTPARSLSFEMLPDTAVRLADLMDAVRSAGHARPSQKVIVEALIHRASTDGEDLERDVLVPYRLEHPEIDNK